MVRRWLCVCVLFVREVKEELSGDGGVGRQLSKQTNEQTVGQVSTNLHVHIASVCTDDFITHTLTPSRHVKCM